jgi:hypothetical protein
MDNRPIVVPEPEDKDPRLYEIKTDYDDKPHADHLKKLTKAVDEANSNASSTKALRVYNEYIEQDGLPYDYPEWLEYVHPGPGSLSHPTNNSSSYHGKWEYYFPDRFWKEGIATGTQFQRGVFAVEQAAREAYVKSGNTAEAFDSMKAELKAALITRFWHNACWHDALFNYADYIEREMDLLDMLTFAAAPRNSDAREAILLPRIETVVAYFKKLFDVLQGCEDDDDVVRNIRNLQNACPSLQESTIISIESLTHLDEVLSQLGAALVSVCAQPKVERIIAIVNMLSPLTNAIGGAHTT